ncbi:MAG: BamA/TamA family outer membrane protein [Candidatus Coatesbacteria bacterium]|nr:MAG: BamA/TamA family outer membrane protein [Candidatus Coatesbacteria bacterium]
MFCRNSVVAILSVLTVAAAAAADDGAPAAADDGTVAAEVFELKKISVGGNRLYTDGEIRNALGLEKGVVYERYLFDYLLEKGIETVKNKYETEGYLDVRISWSFRDVEEDSRKLEIKFNEGERTKLADVLLRGVEKEDYLEVRDNLGVDAGDPMAEGLLRQGIDNIVRYYGDRGYAKTSATYELDRDTRVVTYNVEEGDVMTVGIIDVVGNVKTRPKIITRELELKTGDVYNESKLAKSRENIYKTGLYKDVTVRKFFPGDEDTLDETGRRFGPKADEKLAEFKKRIEARRGITNVVDIIAFVQEDKFRWVEVKPGYSSPDRVAISVGWGDNNFLFNNGQSLVLRGDFAYGFSENNYEIKTDATYTEPWLFGYPYRGVLRLFFEQGIYENYNYWETGLEPKVIKELTEHFEVSGGLKTKRSSLDASVSTDDPEAGDKIKRLYPEAGVKIMTSFIFTGTYDSKDDPFNPLKGNYAYLSEETAGLLLPSGLDFYRIITDFARFQQVGPRATIGFHTHMGYIAPFGGTSDIPAYERFFAGGGYSVRGFGERSLGPKDSAGNPLGGRILGYFNLEFRFQLPFVEGIRVPGLGLNLGNFWSGFFFDGGNAWNNLKEVRKEKLRYGAGLGIRYNTPVGPLRFDYAREIDTTTGDEPSVFYLAFGHAF